MRIDNRQPDELRPVRLTTGFTRFAEGSCLITMGNTMVLCNASVENKVPPHVHAGGWVTAEYNMLPRANRERSARDISRLKLSARSAEIQRLIGRSLRGAVNLELLGEHTVTVDCDVLQADGGTRTASVTGGCVALVLALRTLVERGALKTLPLKSIVTGISAGIVSNEPLLDLCYEEDSSAMVDMNCVMTEHCGLIELQATGEGRAYTAAEQQKLLALCEKGNRELCVLVKNTLGAIK